MRNAAVAISLALMFSVLIAPSALAVPPTIDSFTPTMGAGGASVVITGTGLTGTTAVAFNGTSATFMVDSDTTITATVPEDATTGPIAVITSDGTATTVDDFGVIVPPVISDFDPNTGTWKESVTITGSGFRGVSSVQFNGTEAPFFVNSDRRISARVPSGAGIGPIRVANPAGEDVSDTDFQFRRIRHRVILKMHLEGHLQAIGQVTFPHAGARARIVCGAGRHVRIQREIAGVFRSVGQGETEAEGRFLTALDDRKGEYRAVIKMKRTPNRKCLPDRSLVRTHEHA